MPPSRPNPKKVLLVEGVSDREVVYHLSNHAEIAKDSFTVVCKDSYEKLLKSLFEEVDASEIEHLGILVDADLNIENRWQSISSRLRQCGYEIFSDQPSENGTIVNSPRKPRLGIWIMPNNKVPGILEDFISFLVPPNDSLMPIASEVVRRIPLENRRFIAKDTPKATIYTWLAWQAEPGEPIGRAITDKYFDANLPLAQIFLRWLKQLFDLQ